MREEREREQSFSLGHPLRKGGMGLGMDCVCTMFLYELAGTLPVQGDCISFEKIVIIFFTYYGKM